jgi:hypothetical protein
MNGVNGHIAPPGLWQEARNSDGRIYYYNTITKATQWTKPEELMTLVEASLTSCGTYIVLILTLILACVGRPAMEGIHSRRGPKILV